MIFWMYDVSGDKVLKYKPITNRHIQIGLQAASKTYEEALFRAIWTAHEEKGLRPNLDSMPTFIAKVIEQDDQPDISDTSTLRVFVKRIPLSDEDVIDAEASVVIDRG